jgi:Flp pilus assembly CpaE family ATPase
VFFACWCVKGGAGTTVVTAALALHLSSETGTEVLAVDLGGDLPAALGVSDSASPGVAQWLSSGGEVAADSLARLEQSVAPGLQLLPRGHGPLETTGRARMLLALLGAASRPVVVDCGRIEPYAASDHCADPADVVDLRFDVAAAATNSWLVTRGCYLSLRRAQAMPLRPSGVVFLDEPGRALDQRDVEAVLDVRVVAVVPVDSAIARAVDAGLLVSRLPRALTRALRDAA